MTRRNITKKENFQAEGRMIFKENGLDLNEKWVWVDNQAPTELLGAGHLFFPELHFVCSGLFVLYAFRRDWLHCIMAFSIFDDNNLFFSSTSK